MNDDTLDDDVRAALEPDAGAVDRVVRGALGQHDQRRPVRRRVILTAGAAALLVTGVLVLNRGARTHDMPPTRVTNIGDTIVVRPESGGIWLIGGAGREDDRLPANTIVVYRFGEAR
jgi:hypothetical protein